MNERLPVSNNLVARREKLNNVLSQRQAVRACLEVYGLKRDISEAELVNQLLDQVFGEPASLRIRESLEKKYSPTSGIGVIAKVNRFAKINKKLERMNDGDQRISGLIAALETQLKEQAPPQIKEQGGHLHETRINALTIAISGETPDPRKVIEALGETREGKPHTWPQAAAAVRNALNRLKNVKEKDMTEEERELKAKLLKYMDDNKLISFSQISQRVEDVLRDYGQKQKGLKIKPKEPTLLEMIKEQEATKVGKLNSPISFAFGTLEGDVYNARINGRNQALFLSSIPFEDEAAAVPKSKITDLIYPGDSDGNKKLENLYNGTNITLFNQTKDVLIQRTRIDGEIRYYLRVIKDTEQGPEPSLPEIETVETAASVELPEPDIQPSSTPVKPPSEDAPKVKKWISELEIGGQTVDFLLETEKQAQLLSQLSYKEKGVPEKDLLADRGYLCRVILGQGQNKDSRRRLDEIVSAIQEQIKLKGLQIKVIDTREGVSYYLGPFIGNKPDAVKNTKRDDSPDSRLNIVDESEFLKDNQRKQDMGKIRKLEERTKGQVRSQVREILEDISSKISKEGYPQEPNAEGLTNYFKWLTMGALEKLIKLGYVFPKSNPNKYFDHAYYDICEIAAIGYWKQHMDITKNFDKSLISGLKLVIQQEWEKLIQEEPSSGNGN